MPLVGMNAPRDAFAAAGLGQRERNAVSSGVKVVAPGDVPVHLGGQSVRYRFMVDDRTGSKNAAVLYNEVHGPYEGPFHARTGEEMLFMVSGESVCEVEGGERHVMSERSILFVPPGVRHRHIFSSGVAQTVAILAPPDKGLDEMRRLPVEHK